MKSLISNPKRNKSILRLFLKLYSSIRGGKMILVPRVLRWQIIKWAFLLACCPSVEIAKTPLQNHPLQNHRAHSNYFGTKHHWELEIQFFFQNRAIQLILIKEIMLINVLVYYSFAFTVFQVSDISMVL